ncbi:MAG: S41 family peptidase [Rikenellaceae bacterium]
MKNLLHLLHFAALTLTTVLFISCSSDSEDIDTATDNGLYSVKDSFVEVDNYGGKQSITFLSMGRWVVYSDSDWCTFETDSGDMGDATLTISVAPNVDEATVDERIAQITISIEDYAYNIDLCQVRQSNDVEDKYTTGTDPNLWISEIMTEKYLWNDEFIKIKSLLSFTSDTDTFFSNSLSRMSNIDEDGNYYTSNGERYYYSTLTTYTYGYSSAPATKAFSSSTAFGIKMLYPVQVGNVYYLLIGCIVPESPADKAGLRRGMYITAYDRASISSSTMETYYNTLLGYEESTAMATLSISEYQDNNGTGSYTLTDLGEYYVSPGTHTSNPVIYTKIRESLGGEPTPVGYMVYSEFDMNAADYLISIFEDFKAANVQEVVLDLRYNVGGDVYASTVMATALVGSKYQGETYCEMEYNDYRKAMGEVDYFYIGQNPSVATYSPIVEALDTALDLDRVYVIVTGFTASASELIINGLRGLGVEVLLIGQTTEGKNVGMEVFYSSDSAYSSYDFGSYVYELMPITFYNNNALGFKDFSSGFTVDQSHDETLYILSDWDSDYCVQSALQHILYGSWPSLSSAPSKSTTPTSLPVVNSDELRPRAAGLKVYDAEIVNNL